MSAASLRAWPPRRVQAGVVSRLKMCPHCKGPTHAAGIREWSWRMTGPGHQPRPEGLVARRGAAGPTWAGRGAPRRLALRIALLAALAVLSCRPGRLQGRDDVQFSLLPTGGHRRLLAQAPADPQMATFGQAVLLPPNGTEDGSGSVQFPGLAPLGTVLAAAAGNVLPSVAACTAACRERAECSAFWYCEQEAGCAIPSYNLTAPFRGCQLVFQDITKPGTGRPVLLVPAPGITGGAPLRYIAPAVEGFDAWPGLGYWYRYDLTCADSVSQPGSCGLLGGPQQHAARCRADPDCQVMSFFPEGRDYPGAGQPVVLLKGAPGARMDISEANINLNAIVYKKKAAAGAADGGGGLSAGAIAGIAVGACCAAALAAGAAFIVLRRRRRQRECQSMQGSAAKAGSSASSGSAGGGGGMDSRGMTPTGSGNLRGSGHASSASSHAAAEEQVGLSPLPAASASAQGRQAGGAAAKPPGAEVSVGVAVHTGLPLITTTASPPPPGPPSSASSLPAPEGRFLEPSPAGGAASALPVALGVPSRAYVPPPQPAVPAAPAVLPPLPAVSPAADAPTPRRRSADVAAHPLLSQLPSYGWQRNIVEYSSVQFVLNPDGSYQELGRGASATVYKVVLNGVDPHAAKVFPLGDDLELQLYFLEEASLLSLLRHRFIVGFAGVTVAGGNGIILMELMEGGDLRTRNRELDPKGQRVFGWYQRGRKVAVDIACALHYLHASSGHTHFDVKARNVLLSRDLTAKLADVGFARAIRATHHSIEGPTGTFDYMAPELMAGRKCTSSVDVFSFGVLLWEICTGKYPVRGSLREPQVPEECPAEVADIMADCLQEDPTRRPSAAQLVERLTRLQ